MSAATTENDLGKIIVDCAFQVHKTLGPGLLESAYEVALAHELQKRGLYVERQVPIPVVYDDIEFDEGFRADILVERLVMLELKSVEAVHPVHKKQLLTYLRLADKRLGYLINFGAELIKDGISRITNGVEDWGTRGKVSREGAKGRIFMTETLRGLASSRALSSFFDNLDSFAEAPEGVAKLRAFVLDLAVRGKLVEQDENEEPASELLDEIANGTASREVPAEDQPYPLPSSWAWSPLGAVADILMGNSPPGTSYNDSGEGEPLINGPVEFSPKPFGKTIESKFTTEPTKMCATGDLLICVRGSTTGRTDIAAFDACIGRGVAAIRSRIHSPYLIYVILSMRDSIYESGTGSTFKSISQKQLFAYPIPLPPLSEQRRIVSKVDGLMSLCDELEAQGRERVRLLERASRSSLDCLVNAGVQPLGCQGREKAGTANPKQAKAWTPTESLSSAWQRLSDHFEVLYAPPKPSPTSASPSSNSPSKANSSLLFNRTNSYELVGKTGIFKGPSEQYTFASYLIRLRPFDGVCPEYVNLAMNAGYYRTTQIEPELTQQCGQANFNGTKMKNSLIPLPPNAEQKRIVAKVDWLLSQCDELSARWRERQSATQELLTATIHHLLNEA